MFCVAGLTATVLYLAHILHYSTNFYAAEINGFGVLFLFCFFSIEMDLLTAIIFLAALLHQSDGQVGAITSAKEP